MSMTLSNVLAVGVLLAAGQITTSSAEPGVPYDSAGTGCRVQDTVLLGVDATARQQLRGMLRARVEDAGPEACVVKYEVKESPPARLGRFCLAAEETPRRGDVPKPVSPPLPGQGSPATGYALPASNAVPLVSSVGRSERFSFRLRDCFGPTVQAPIRETEWTRTYWRFGMMNLSLGQDVYLGNGLAAGVELESGWNGLSVPLNLHWFPVEGVQLSLGFDVLRWRLIPALSVSP